MYEATRSLRSDPPIQDVRGDDQIRTGGRCLGADSVYERRTAPCFATLYAVALGLVVTAALGFWYVAAYAAVVGPAVGWRVARRTA